MELIVGLALVLGYITGALYLIGWAGKWAEERKFGLLGRAGAMFAVFFLTCLVIPLGDHAAGYMYFVHRCDREGGIKIIRTVQNVEGLWWWPADGETAQSLGYSYIEGGKNPEKLTRYEVNDGLVAIHPNVRTISRYVFRGLQTEGIELGVVRQRYVIEDVQVNEPLAIATSFQYRGGWLVRALLAGFGGTAAMCHTKIDHKAFVVSVLQPLPGRK